MGILAQCPIGSKKQSIKNKPCSCGENIDKTRQDKARQSNRKGSDIGLIIGLKMELTTV
jgi:hypothetical protein